MKKYVDVGLREINSLLLKLFSKNEIIVGYNSNKKLMNKKNLKQ
jgi:hypothetical protein|tara:strand:- start:2044 stop:2175 length:132 start_codon:yes stop_codon:yes gene_type:complete